MRYLGLMFFSLALAGAAHAKGFLASGTYEGTDTRGKTYRLSLELVNIPGTTTVVTGCNFDSFCQQVARRDLNDGRHTVSILDLYGTNETYEPERWGVTYGMIGPRRVFYPLFTLHIRNPMESEMTLTPLGGQPVRLKRRP